MEACQWLHARSNGVARIPSGGSVQNTRHKDKTSVYRLGHVENDCTYSATHYRGDYYANDWKAPMPLLLQHWNDVNNTNMENCLL